MRYLLVYRKDEKFVQGDFERVTGSLAASGLEGKEVPRGKMRREDLEDIDILFILGGDGTFTSTLQKLHVRDDTDRPVEFPILGIADQPSSRAFFMRSDISSFKGHLERIMAGDYRTVNIPRLRCSIRTDIGNLVYTNLALNEFFIGNTFQYLTSYLTIGKGVRGDPEMKEVIHSGNSSGLIVSTSMGRGAWIHNAAYHYRDLTASHESMDRYLLWIREAGPDSLVHEFGEGEVLIISSDTHKGIVVADSWNEYSFNRGSSLRIGLSYPRDRLPFIFFGDSFC